MAKKRPNNFKTENEYQAEVIKKLKDIYGENNVNKLPGSVRQGIPDIEVTCGPKYARLEAKAYQDAEHQPNQDYYVNYTNEQGAFARFIYPENEEQVLSDLSDYFNK